MLKIILNIDNFIIEFVQSFITPFLTEFFSFLTRFAGEDGLILFIVLIYIFFEREKFYQSLCIIAVNLLFVIGVKSTFKRDRPYLNGYKAPDDIYTKGHSFPSGHSSNITTINLLFNHNFKDVIIKILFISLNVLIPISRIYLGQHYFTDCLIGILISLIVTNVLIRVFHHFNFKLDFIFFIVGILLPFLLFIQSNDIYMYVGILIPLLVFSYLDKKYFNLSSYLKNINKYVLLFLYLIVIFSNFLFLTSSNLWFNFLRYFIVGSYISFILPLCCKIFTLIAKKE
ncbi:MAG: phosphatase PAP2 family protein [Acholeplasmatales bacterium]|nr:phosphatase PAP2 family protein [Acholeplasmatales bacterium]